MARPEDASNTCTSPREEQNLTKVRMGCLNCFMREEARAT